MLSNKRASTADRDDTGGGNTPASSPRGGRGWGPFTGGQLSAIIITLAIVIGFPVAANAVTGSNVFVTDPATGTRAVVDATGSLRTGTSAPKNFFFGHADIASFGPILVTKPVAGQALVVTTIMIDTRVDATPGSSDEIGVYVSRTNATCASTGGPVESLTPLTIGQTELRLQPGVVVPAGRALCAVNTDAAHLDAWVYAYGYAIPAAAAPAGS